MQVHIWKRRWSFAENHVKFNPDQSSSFQWGSQSISIQYGTGSMTGYLGIDTVEVSKGPGAKWIVYLDFKQAYSASVVCLPRDWQLSRVQVGGFSVTNQVFGLSQSEAPFMAQMQADGILGLAFQSIASDNVVPVFDNMMKQGLVKNSMFSVYLSRYWEKMVWRKSVVWECAFHIKIHLWFFSSLSVRDSEEGSEVLFGDVDSNHYNGPVTWIPLTSATYWQIQMDRFSEMNLKSVSQSNKWWLPYHIK